MSRQQMEPDQARRLLHTAAAAYDAPADGFDGVRSGYARRRRARRASAIGIGAITLSALGLGLVQLIPAAGTRTHVIVPAGNPTAGGPNPAPVPTTLRSASGAPDEPAPCRTSQLEVALSPAPNAAGTFYDKINFLNTGPGACTLRGYPGVSFIDAAGKQLGYPAAEGSIAGVKVTTVLLKGAGLAVALVGIPDAYNFPSTLCDPATPYQMRVYPPNQTTSTLIAFRTTLCTTTHGRTTVAPVQPAPGS